MGFFDPPPGPKCASTLYDAIWDSASNECSLYSGYSFWVITAPPTADEITSICQEESCANVVKAMREAASEECVLRDGYYLYQDILAPIVTTCTSKSKAPATTTATPTTTPSSVSGGLAPSSTPTTSATATPSPWTTLSPSTTSHAAADLVSNQASAVKNEVISTAMIALIIVGCVIGVAIVGAIIICSRQRNKRDPTVQREQRLSYGNVGDFDTLAATEYSNMEAGAKRPSSHQPQSRPSATSTQSSATVSNTSVVSDPRMAALWENQLIVAARIPIDKIVVGEVLSSGGYGVVYRGTYKQQEVAIKRLLPRHRNDAAAIQALLEEIKLMATLDHERIVCFVGVAWSSAGELSAVTEYMPRGDLCSTLAQFDKQRHPTGFDATKVKIALHIAHALTYLHSLQPVVLHRDLKSRNILLTQEYDAKVTDFGVSRELADNTMTQGVGTSLWMAPEIMLGGRYDEKADIFSFGVVLSELDSNKLPYAEQLALGGPAGRTAAEIMQTVALGRLTVEFSYSSDPDLAALGRDCVVLDPKARPTAAQVLHRVHTVWQTYAAMM